MKKLTTCFIGIVCVLAVTVCQAQQNDMTQDQAKYQEYLENYKSNPNQSEEPLIQEDIDAHQKASEARKAELQNYQPEKPAGKELLDEEKEKNDSPDELKKTSSSVLGESKPDTGDKDVTKPSDRLYVPANADFIIEDEQPDLNEINN